MARRAVGLPGLRVSRWVAFGLFALTAAAGHAQSSLMTSVDLPEEVTIGNLSVAAARGAFLPLSQTASVSASRAYATGLVGYDGARHAATFEAAAELRLWGPIALRGGAVGTSAGGALRPSVGARAQALREDRHGVDASVGISYRPEGLTEPEGEIESVVSVGRHAGATYLLANLLYGQDPDGRERDGEVRAAALRPVGRSLVVGADGRMRVDLGSDRAKLIAHQEPTMDALVGPVATALVGPVGVSLQAGGSGLRPAGDARTRLGVFVLSGLGTCF